MTAALWMLFWNSVLFFFVGRWSVIRGPRYRMGDQVVDDIQGILDKRPMIGDNGMVITNRRKWRAFGYDWIMSKELRSYWQAVIKGIKENRND
jgi:hypothetical protein